MKQDLDVAQRLETGPEARLRPPDAFRDRPDATAIERVEVENAIRLAEAKGPQHDGFRLVRAPGHCDQV